MAVLVNILFWSFIGLLVYLFNRYFRTRYDTGHLSVAGKDDSYPYVIGDTLHFGGGVNGVFNGIDIILPAPMPALYLDGRIKQGLIGPRRFVERDQSLQLEGEFGRYFHCYAPRQYQTLVLSILTPDVMQTLMDHAGTFDVEISGQHLRIISAQKIYTSADRRQVLLDVATKLLAEINHRFDSWTLNNAMMSRSATLVTEDNPVVYLLGRRVRLTTIALWIFYALPAVLMWAGELQSYGYLSHRSWQDVIGAYWLPFMYFPVLFVALILGIPRGWFRWVGILANWLQRYSG